MGFYFRKALNFGPFRLNLSRSGVGVSVGVKGARIGVSPRGQTYIHAGRGGFYYRQTLSPGLTHPRTTTPPPGTTPQSSLPVVSSPASDLGDNPSDALLPSDAVLDELNRIHARYQAFPIATVIVVLGLLALIATFGSDATIYPVLRVATVIVACLLGASIALYAWRLDGTEGATVMHFDLAGGADRRFATFLEKFASFSSCERIWCIKTQESTDDWKRSAGATTPVSRDNAVACLSVPPHVQTNIEAPTLRAGVHTLYFFPDGSWSTTGRE
jgi:hypothetical protein